MAVRGVKRTQRRHRESDANDREQSLQTASIGLKLDDRFLLGRQWGTANGDRWLAAEPWPRTVWGGLPRQRDWCGETRHKTGQFGAPDGRRMPEPALAGPRRPCPDWKSCA